MTPTKGTVVLDLDGVLHSYASGWQGETTIGDPPVEGAQAFVRSLIAAGYDPVVASTRCNSEAGRGAVASWLVKHDFPLGLRIAEGKPAGLVYLDDRALRFTGVWPTVSEIEAAATPWNRM